MTDVRRVLDNALLYRVWQAPFAEQKFGPILRHNDITKVGRVLDVGCGPGTNTHHFLHTEYVGVDLNPQYVQSAIEKYGPRFHLADVTTDDMQLGSFDFILANSLMHHLDEAGVVRLLQKMRELLGAEGEVHVLDLVLPPRAGAGRWLALQDRGEHPRTLEHWKQLFESYFDTVLFEPYSLQLAGVDLWSMVYFKGRRRSA